LAAAFLAAHSLGLVGLGLATFASFLLGTITQIPKVNNLLGGCGVLGTRVDLTTHLVRGPTVLSAVLKIMKSFAHVTSSFS
jgi:hypothetical protein